MTVSMEHLSNPRASFWIEASAGTGKTKILVDRVINLLLAGSKADGLLCLTFTKAAAAEMANRIRDTLSTWASLSEPHLKKELQQVTRMADVDHLMSRARTLLNEVLRVPGGLHIQTIHGFCQYVLKRFPLEAHIVPHFQVMDEQQQRVLQEKAFAMAIGALDSPTLGCLFPYGNPGQLQGLLQDPALYHLKETPQVLSAEAILKGHRTTLDPLLHARWDEMPWENYKNIFLTQKNTVRKKIALEGIPSDKISLEAARVLDTLEQLKNHEILTASTALKKLHKAYVQAYETLKTSNAFLDYDDLIQKTAHLVQSPAMGAWVLFKLDQGIDHILVDEAQDTNQAQWDIIKGLTHEFFAGHGARETPRSIFVVGDSKQSIYSFQGADPVAFSTMRGLLQEQVRGAGLPFYIEDLSISYRSASPVLQAVDQVFNNHPDYRRHIPSRHQDQGMVEIWPLLGPLEKGEEGALDLPLTPLYVTSPKQRLAEKIANRVKEWIDHKETLASKGRPIEPRDIMILVRHRDELGNALIRAFKKCNIPMAGIDRLKLSDHILIQDLIAIGKWCLFPQDDLLLATILKGPFFKYTDDQLFALCNDRGVQTLWYQLQNAPPAADDYDHLQTWQNWARTFPPYEFFTRISVKHRAYLQGRFGQEGEDVLNEFLTLCLQSEYTNLTLFLQWFDAYPQEIKRDFEQAQENYVRILTVHGSKGLQAPIVFLPDTTQVPSDTSVFMEVGDQETLWIPKAPLRPLDPPGNFLSRDQQEYERLLYVAMTRAEDRLYICGASTQDMAKLPENCWYQILLSKLEPIMEPLVLGEEKVWRLDSPQVKEVSLHHPGETVAALAVLPSWHETPLASEYVKREKPSEAVESYDDKLILLNEIVMDLADERPIDLLKTSDTLTPAERGILIHKLLEHLYPLTPQERLNKGEQLIRHSKAPGDILEEVLNVLEMPTIDFYFTAPSYGEVGVIGTIHGKTYKGFIDRLVVDKTHQKVYIVDFKSGHMPAQVSPTYQHQLSIYGALLKPSFPDYTMIGKLIWTKSQVIQEVEIISLE